MNRPIAFLLIGFISTGCIRNEPEFEQILAVEAQRESCAQLIRFLDDPEPRIRTRAVQAMARLQDSTCVEHIIRMLRDVNHNVRLQAAFALGQIATPSAEASLIARLRANDLTTVKICVLEALGKLGCERTFPSLFSLFKSYDSDLRAAAALAAGRMATRGLRNQALTDSLTLLLKDEDAEVRWRAAYSLMRIGHDLDPQSLLAAAKEEDARVRMYAIRALANLRDYAFLEQLGERLHNDRDWRVRVQAAKGLGNFPLSLSANYLSLLDQIQPVRLAIIQAIGASALLEPEGYRPNSREHNYAKTQVEQLLAGTNGDAHWTVPERGFALISYAKLLKEKGIPAILKFTSHENERLRARAMTALGETGAPQVVRTLMADYHDAPTIVKIAILEALDKIDDPSISEVYAKALQEIDAVLVALAAQGLSADSLRNRIYSKRIVEAYQNLPQPADLESVLMIFKAMAKFQEHDAVPVLEEALKTGGKVVSAAAAAALTHITGDQHAIKVGAHEAREYDYSEIFALENARAVMHTVRGEVEIELFAKEAPVTVLNFVRLAEQDFFNDLTFHRVVPNYVIQGGDPRGDGWGSPGYAIHSEFNTHPYVRGTVGMASAGKDTEGCQFFITHSPQPHLDGRYTAFGQVTSGMEVVDAIQEGDRIETIAIRR
ncbi:MAG: HEAT repeat domain-containing protein [bacterium]